MVYQKWAVLVATVWMISETALANPVLDGVASGEVTVQNTDPNTLQVNQTSAQAIIDWRSFNIAPNEATHFIQPAGGVALNRIDPAQGASQIFGTLTATGKIILINQNGIFFGPGSKIDVVGIVASTSGISAENFLAGRYVFDQPGVTPGSIINQGDIVAAEHGLVALMGNNVANDGTIRARLGNVVLASGKTFTVDFRGDQMINFAINEAAGASSSSEMREGVRNSGVISANGGVVILSAKAAEGVLDQVINTTGVIEAKSVGMQNGEIILSGEETPNGMVHVAGTVDASGLASGSSGGSVQITGKKILVDNGTTIDVSGDAGGGSILIGGDAHGLGTLAHADMTVIMPNARLLADAVTTGDGGKIVVWSDLLTRAYGEFSARGGALSGNGGFIETSSPVYLDVNGIRVNTLAINGKRGEWLLDPNDLLISDVSDDDNVTTGSLFEPSGPAPSTLSSATINTALASSDVTIQTGTGTEGSQDGNINFNSSQITWGDTTLTIISAAAISVDAMSQFNVTGAGNLTMTAQQGGINFDSAALVQVPNGTFTLTAGGTSSLPIINNTVRDLVYTNTTGNSLGITSVTTTGSQTYNGTVILYSTAGPTIGLFTSGTGTNITVNGTLGVFNAGGSNPIVGGTGGGGNTIAINGDMSFFGPSMQLVFQNSGPASSNAINLSGLTTINSATGILNMTLDGTSNDITSGSLSNGAMTLATFSGFQTVTGNNTGSLTIPTGPGGKAYPVTLTSASSGSIADPFVYSGFTYGNYVPPTPTPTNSDITQFQNTVVSVTTSGTTTYLTGSSTPTLMTDVGAEITNDINTINISLQQQDMEDAPTASLLAATCGR